MYVSNFWMKFSAKIILSSCFTSSNQYALQMQYFFSKLQVYEIKYFIFEHALYENNYLFGHAENKMNQFKWKNEKLQVLGLGLLIAGILVKINALSSDVTPALNSVEVAGYKLGDLANNLSIVFIVIGAFIVLVSGLGLIGGCCEVRWMLVVVLI